MTPGHCSSTATWLRLRACSAGTSRIFEQQAVGDVDRLGGGLLPPPPQKLKEGLVGLCGRRPSEKEVMQLLMSQ